MAVLKGLHPTRANFLGGSLLQDSLHQYRETFTYLDSMCVTPKSRGGAFGSK